MVCLALFFKLHSRHAAYGPLISLITYVNILLGSKFMALLSLMWNYLGSSCYRRCWMYILSFQMQICRHIDPRYNNKKSAGSKTSVDWRWSWRWKVRQACHYSRTLSQVCSPWAIFLHHAATQCRRRFNRFLWMSKMFTQIFC